MLHRQYLILDYGNTCLPFFPGIIFLHDIYCEFFPEDFTGLRNKLVRLYNRFQYRLIARKARKICTVSMFTKNQIMDTYHVKADKVEVIYSSYDHFSTIKSDPSIFNTFPILNNPFFFILGSLSKRKNLKWVLDYASKNPDSLFAISGVSITTTDAGISKNVPKNIVFLGFLDDARVKALMEKCMAFLLPSYYEGFGLTPLEALSCGARIIVSSASSLREIYGKSANYIDPYNTDIDLENLLLNPVESASLTLNKYSYEKSATKLYKVIKETTNIGS